MIKIYLVLSKSSYRFLWVFSIAAFLVTNISGNDVPAFPGAEGFGKYSRGGREGEVIVVSNLNNSGPGSLRAAVDHEGPRIIVFSVSGIINLETPVFIRNPYVSILGHTAPGKGVAIRGNQLHIQTHDVVIRFLRIRVGDVNFGELNHWRSLDGIDIGWGDSGVVYNIIIDHCSISWGTDENVGFWSSSKNITIQNSIISEGLHYGKNIESRSMGMLIGPKAERISILNNLFIHNDKRNPRIGNGGLSDIRNNIIYNPGFMGMNIWNDLNLKSQQVNIVKNLFVAGPNTQFDREISIWDPDIYPGKVYLRDNMGFDGNPNKNNWRMVQDAKSPRDPITTEQIERVRSDEEFLSEVSGTKSFNEMRGFAQNYCGASLPLRDEVDHRLINEFMKGKGRIISSQDEVGGWPIYNLKINRIGKFSSGDEQDIIPEDWRDKYNVLPGEENMDFNNNGYTNIEEYLNGTDPRSDNQPSPLDIFSTYGFNDIPDLNNLSLEQNYPNPFYFSTNIAFSIHHSGTIILNIYNYQGKKVHEVVKSDLYPGSYEIIWEPVGMMPGLYIATIFLNHSENESIILIKN